jgi:hypothetical protein
MFLKKKKIYFSTCPNSYNEKEMAVSMYCDKMMAVKWHDKRSLQYRG